MGRQLAGRGDTGQAAGVTMPTADGHRDDAERALAGAQRNPILSADQLTQVALVHALLAIEQRLRDLLDLRVDVASNGSSAVVRAS